MSDQRCGTCEWWGSVNAIQIGSKLRGCANPDCNQFEDLVYDDDGANCPSYERKERDEREGAD